MGQFSDSYVSVSKNLKGKRIVQIYNHENENNAFIAVKVVQIQTMFSIFHSENIRKTKDITHWHLTDHVIASQLCVWH